MCPDGEIRQVAKVEANSLLRGKDAVVTVSALALYATGPSAQASSALVTKGEPSLSLVDRVGNETPLADAKLFQNDDGRFRATVRVPSVPDGEYQLRARIKTVFGASQIDAPFAFYAPAKVHVLTDRPLYEPSNTMKFRALVLKARDLTPLDGRPGTWVVTDPSGQVVLEERSPAGPWGVTSGSFPLDQGAASGTWKVRWSSGDASDEVSVKVEPFTLPRFHVEAQASKPFYRIREKPQVKGTVVYSSGAPVVGAQVALEWSKEGEWPMPTAWEEGELPQNGTTDKNGTFTLNLPQVPDDLRGRATLNASIAVTDAAGDHVEGSASVLLTEDGLQVSAVTEMGQALVEGYNNRLYLRVTDPAGVVLPTADVTVRRAWDGTDKGTAAKADEDGVAALQIDPGPAVNIVIPPMPFRLPAPQPLVSRGSVTNLLHPSEAALALEQALDAWLPKLESCGRYQHGNRADVKVGLQVSRSGAVDVVTAYVDPLTRCLGRALSSMKLPPGAERLYSVELSVDEPEIPSLDVSVVDAASSVAAVKDQLQELALDARECLPLTVSDSALPQQLLWRVKAGEKTASMEWLDAEHVPSISPSVMGCIRERFKTVKLPDAAAVDAAGVATFSVRSIQVPDSAKPQATTMLGYELLVSAKVDGREIGLTKLRLNPGQLPEIRLRATPVLPRPGDTVAVQIIRGPSFEGELPKELALTGGKDPIKAKVDEKTRTASFKLPAEAEGWFSVSWRSATTRVYVQPKKALSVAVASDQQRYAPGQKAKLTVRTTMNGAGTQAAVGLFGVDQSLGQLVTLAGADELARLRPKVPMSGEAFPSLDGQALVMGRVRGANAAAAIVAQVGLPEALAEADRPVGASARGDIDTVEELTETFFTVLGELHAKERSWEEHAKPDEQMHPPQMAKLWEQAVAACEKRGERVTDAFHRKLKLSRLPPTLLALTDPRVVVVDGKHLPEDVENWSAYVAKEQP